ncbi:uncharacterized protein LOC135392523 [Ornithodoros turicata]|uniref:uncharacterized protein LOC135392523 n=1 Tax=Ornithodoros turicata TaxID=34597 RepID=UPI003139137C
MTPTPNDSQLLPVYTDGSVSQGGSTAVFYIPHENLELTHRLSYETSSTESELFAILTALNHIAGSAPGAWTVFTDSKAALEVLANYCSRTIGGLDTMIVATYNRLLSLGHSLCFQWVPSHIGLHGYTRADALARRAHGEVTFNNCLLPLSAAACRLQTQRLCHSGTRQFQENVVRLNDHLWSIDPSMDFVATHHCSRQEASIIHRLRLNAARTPLLLCKMGRLQSPKCPTCAVEADIQHLVLDCHRFDTLRATLRRRLLELRCTDFSLATLLGPVRHHTHRSVNKAVLTFLSDSGPMNSL